MRPIGRERLLRSASHVTLCVIVACAGFLSGGCSKRGQKEGGTVPSFEVVIDPKLKPASQPLPRYPDGAPRPLVTLTDKSRKQTDFVENELLVEFATQNELNAFLARTRGSVLAVDRPKTVGIKANPTYLIRVQTETADLSRLTANLSGLSPKGGSAITVSSEAARRLIALGAEAAVSGKHVGINYLTTDAGFQDGQLAEAPAIVPPPAPNDPAHNIIDDSGALVETWNPNPFNWVYMKAGGNFDIGVTRAWKVLEQVGAFDRKVTIAVIGGGFGAGDDFPAPYEFNKASFAALDPTGPNEVSCSGDSVCRWHGWNVVNAAMGQVNNGIGAAGPGGPVAKLIAIRRSADIFNNIQSITLALFSGANIINMSFSARIPAALYWSVISFDLATLRAQAAGKLLVASAGNSSEDINEEDCIGPICWESAWWTPCENGGVLCVGAMDGGKPVPRNTSNYGSDELDIWGPGAVWVSGDYDDNLPHVFTATSAAAPFIAGVAALIWAANPNLNNDQVESVLYETAHQKRNDSEVERWPNAYAAVTRALGGTPPDITIRVEPSQEFGSCQGQFHFTADVVDPDNGPPTVTWASDITGPLGTGDSFTRPLPDGTHRITATAVDGIGLRSQSNEVVLPVANITSAPKPTISIISLANHQTFASNQTLTFEAGGLDPNRALGGLLAANVRWVSSRDGELGTGQRIFRTLSPGAHYIYVYYTGVCGNTADDFRLIQITEGVVDAPPNMMITTPSTNDRLIYADTSGQACLRVAGFGYDEEDQDFATIEWWETNRTDLQWKVLSFDQNTTVCLKLAPNGTVTTHEIRLRGKDGKGHSAYSAPLRVTVAPGVR
jgi:serine protease